MFKIITSLALTAGVFVQPSIASEIINLPTELVCADKDRITETIKEYGEEPVMKSLSIRETNSGLKTNVSILFVNPQTKTWTMVERFRDDLFCVTSLGTDASPFAK